MNLLKKNCLVIPLLFVSLSVSAGADPETLCKLGGEYSDYCDLVEKDKQVKSKPGNNYFGYSKNKRIAETRNDKDYSTVAYKISTPVDEKLFRRGFILVNKVTSTSIGVK